MIAVLLGAAHLDMSALESAFKTAGWEPRTVRSEAALIEGGQRGPEPDAAREELEGRGRRRSAILLPMEAEGVNTGARMVRTLRRNRIRIPIVLVTSSLDRNETRNAVAAALRSGADDFFISSISHAELALRLTALVERNRRRDAVGVIRIGDLEVDRVSRILKRQGRSIALTACEYRTFQCLARCAGKPVAREVILRRLRRSKEATTSNLVDVYILYLRRKLARIESRCTVQTMRGIGYMLTDGPGSDEPVGETPQIPSSSRTLAGSGR